MPRWLRGGLILVLVSAAAGLGLGQPAGKSDPKDAKGAESSKKMPLEKMKGPAGSIFVVVEDLKEAILSGKMVYMSVEKFQELMAAVEKQQKGDKKTPHSCRLTGRAEGDHVSLDAEFTFSTEKPNTTVILGLQGAHLTKEGSLDGQIPHLDFGDEGFAVHVENAGDHRLSLSMELPVAVRRAGAGAPGPERGFELGLAGAAVTTMALELPAGVKDLRWKAKDGEDTVEKRRPSGRWEWALPVRAKTVAVSWKEPIAYPGAGPLLSAEGQVVVVVDETQVLITADLFLEPLRGQASEWQLLLPPQAKLDVKSAGGLPEPLPIDKKGAVQILKLKEPSGDRLHVVAQVGYVRPAGGGKVPIGPFAVLGAHQQSGTIFVKTTPEALRGARLVYHRHGDVSQREASKNPLGTEGLVASFQYWSLPGPGLSKPVVPSKGPRGVPLEIEIKSEKGQIETQVDHQLRLRKVAEGYQVEATTRIKGSALYGPVDFLDVQLPRLPTEPLTALTSVAPVPYPAGLPWGPLFWAGQAQGTSAAPAEYVCEGDGELPPPDVFRRARIKLAPKGKDLTVVLLAKYLLPRQPERARLELPRPLGVVDRGGKVTVTTAVDNYLELVNETGEPVLERHQQIVESELTPRFVNFAWRPYTPELAVIGETDVEIRTGFARVRHQVTLPAPARELLGQKPPRRVVVFRLPPTLQGFKLDGKFPEEKGVARATVSGRDKETLLLEYDVALPAGKNGEGDDASVLDVPLLWPERATRVDAKVRVWCEPGAVPSLAKAGLVNEVWKNVGPEIVPQRDSLPALVLASSGPELPLQLHIQRPAAPRQIDVLIDRALIEVSADQEGHHYRARFLVRRFNTRRLTLVLPVEAVVQKVLLDGKGLPYRAEQNGLHLEIEPELFSEPVFLEVVYQVPALALEGQAFWQAQFEPPVFRESGFVKRVGWQLRLPPGMTPLITSPDTTLEYRWSFRHGIFAPEAVSGGDWSTSGRSSGASSSASPSGPPSATVWRDTLTPLRATQLPWQAWFLVCSGALLVIGLALSLASLPRLSVVFAAGAILVGFLVVRMVAPALAPMLLFGCQPGLVVLVVVVAVQWMVRQRYRRQLVFLPGFMRLQSGSSLIRGGSSARQREPTTVDAPPSGPSGQGAVPSQGS